MKKLISLAAITIIGALLAFVLIPENKTAPAFSLANLKGENISNTQLQGKVTFINFWFPSCPGCVSEMPKVIKMSNDYQGKDFQVLGIAQPIDPLASVHQYVQNNAIPFTIMFDADGAVGKSFETKVYPTSFLINKKGEILKTFVGEPDFPTLYQEIDKELAK